MVYSFDIFDTCLVRKCGEPNCVFDIMAERAFTHPVSSNDKRSFVAARLEAAAISWSEKQTLSDIYRAFHFDHSYLLHTNDLVMLEQTIERDMLCPVQEMANLIVSLRQAGHHIVFISDMYLDSTFILSVLQETGLWRHGDSLYVSCDVGATKASGQLYAYVHQKENIPYRQWHHYGDNAISDVKVPRKLGIHAHAISHNHTPYQLIMKRQSSLYYQWGGMMAGISKTIALQSERSAHKDFVLDIIAPLFVSFVWRVFSDAQKKGIQHLYFCARDAYPLYRIAVKMQDLFPKVFVHYLYISRQSLYNGDDMNKIGYYSQIGLASKTDNNAIVDVRSSGKSLQVLNELMSRYGYNSVYGYFFEICSYEQRQSINYYAELDDMYLQQLSEALRKLPSNWYMYELFFPLNTQKRTIGYEHNGKEYIPVLEEEDKKEYRLNNLQELVDWRNWAIDIYTEYYIQLGLHLYTGEIFNQYVIPQLADFFLFPIKHYLRALDGFWGKHPDKGYIPYVDNSIFRLLANILESRSLWKRGTIFYSLPTWLCKLLYSNK